MTEATTSGVVPINDNEGIRKVLLPEQGPVLPLPDEEGNQFRIGEFDRWTLKREKELGEKRKQNPEANLAEWVGMLLGEMCSSVGPHDIKRMNEAERRLLFNQMAMPDVLYLYTWLRYVALGPELRIKLKCPYHDYKFVWTGDLRTLDIRVPSTWGDTLWDIDLRDPFEIRGEKATTLRCAPPKWNAVEQSGIGRRVNQGQLKATMIHASILSVGDRDIALTQGDLDEMSKRDLERHLAGIDEHSLGPDFIIEARCDHPKCEQQFETSLDWSYDSFFAFSSR